MKQSLFEGAHDGFRILKVLAIVSIPVALLLFHVWNQYRITQLGYEVAQQTREHRELIEEQRKLSIEATFQGRTERVLSLAKEKYGLEPLRPEQIVEVDQTDSHNSQEQAALHLLRHEQ